jgi:DNA modification methylase
LLPILQTSKENDVILDPFCGTGTVGFVANSINRKFIGYDIN